MNFKFLKQNNNIKIDTEKPLIGHFINSFFEGVDVTKFEKIILDFLENPKGLRSLGTYDDLFVRVIQEDNKKYVVIFDGHGQGEYQYEGSEIKILLSEFMNILEAYLVELKS